MPGGPATGTDPNPADPSDPANLDLPKGFEKFLGK
jgi:hypothetical protein